MPRLHFADQIVSRRKFLRLSALIGVSAGVAAACSAPAPAAPTLAPAAAPTAAAAAAQAKPTAAVQATSAPAPTAAAAAKPTAGAAGATGATPATGATGATPATGGAGATGATAASGEATLVLGVDAETLDPHVTTNAFSLSMMKAIFDTLVVFDNTLAPQPGLATSWETPNDSTWRFKLRQGVKFHDGSPFNAQAAK